jgi:Flp pilus assembly pilin Flp
LESFDAGNVSLRDTEVMFTNRRKLHGEEGQGLVEYSLIILLMALVIVGALGVFGTGVYTLYSTIVGSF